MKRGTTLTRLEPLRGGRDTEIDMIEREMEGGCVVIQPPEVQEDFSERRLGGLVGLEEHVEVRAMRATRSGEPTT